MVGDSYKSPGSFFNGFTEELGRAIFSYNVMHITPGSNHTGTGSKLWNNTRSFSILGNRRKSNNRFAAIWMSSTTYKIYLPANTTVQFWSEWIRTNLPGKINFDCRIYSYHLFVLRNNKWIIYIFLGMKFNDRIIINKIENSLCTKYKTCNYFTGM